MATTLAEIGQYLDNRGWNYELQGANSQMITGYKAENVEQFLIVIQHFRSPPLGKGRVRVGSS